MESKIVKEPRTVPTIRHSSPISNSEERDLENIFASLSLKPSNLPARDAPWKWSLKHKMLRIDSKRLPLRLKRSCANMADIVTDNGFKFSGLSRLFILHK
ncbi:unnamed protein product [Prunus armeniaca]